jgi:hypothetical protein
MWLTDHSELNLSECETVLEFRDKFVYERSAFYIIKDNNHFWCSFYSSKGKQELTIFWMEA